MQPRSSALLLATAIASLGWLAMPASADEAGKAPSSFTEQRHAAALAALPKDLAKEEDFASRGFIATRAKPQILQADGKPSADLNSYAFIEGKAPASVDPALWEHSRLAAKHGLFKVTDGIYQVRGFDVSNITFIQSDNGYIVVDPLTSGDASKAALELLRQHVGDKPVTAVIYTHPHSDHFAGVGGIVDAQKVASGEIPVIAPVGFMKELVQEWILAGNAMGRRGFYQFGLELPPGERGKVGLGMGPFVAFGQYSLIPPTRTISEPMQRLTVDGLEIVFQLTPGAEAPTEFNFYIPRYKALCSAETATSSLHNVLTLRGAEVRDAKAWADYLTEAQDKFGDAELVFMTHHWPRFGKGEVHDFLGNQRDTYKFLHDQSVRMMNLGMTPDEIAENLTLPAELSRLWYNRGFYGTLKHNAKAVYQKYMGWYDGIPADLDRQPPVERAKRYVAALGGADAALKQVRAAMDKGDYRWAAELGNHLVFADPQSKAARGVLADAYEQLGYQAQSAVWRNIYLTGAMELRNGGVHKFAGAKRNELVAAASTGDLLDLLATRLDPARAAGKQTGFNLQVSDRGDQVLVTVHNSVLVHRQDASDAQLPTIRAQLNGLLAVLLAGMPVDQAVAHGLIEQGQDLAALTTLAGLIENPQLEFNIIEP